jgi:hypothetical protein
MVGTGERQLGLGDFQGGSDPAMTQSGLDGCGFPIRIGLSAYRLKLFSEIWGQRVYQTSVGPSGLSSFLPGVIGAMWCPTYHNYHVRVDFEEGEF